MTLSYIEDALRWFHTFNEVFLLGRAGKMVKAKANAMTMKLMMQWLVGEAANADTSMPSKKLHKMTSWRDSISLEIDVSNELNAHFNIANI